MYMYILKWGYVNNNIHIIIISIYSIDIIKAISKVVRHVTTPHGEVSDEPQNITQSLHGGELSVVAVVVVTHTLDTGGRSTEYDGDESIAAYESILVIIVAYENILVSIYQTV